MVEQAARTILDDVRDEGWREGEKKGRLEGVQHILQRRLRNLGFHISQTVEAQLKAASWEELSQWSDRLDRGEAPKHIFEMNGATDEPK